MAMNVEKRAIAFEMREQGKTLQEIADTLGVTKQRVAQYFAGTKYAAGRHYRKVRSIYPNLANWMYENNFCIATLLVNMGYQYTADNALRLKRRVNGDAEFRMRDIKKILELTGMTFEECFKEDKA